MARSDVHWKGLKAVEVMVNVLPTKIAKQKLRKAYMYALTPVRTEMRDKIPRGRTGRLWFATDITIGGGQELHQMWAIVGPRRKRGVWNQQGWHAHMVELGTKAHDITAGTGKMMPIFKKGSSGPVGFAKTIHHKGAKAYKPFSKTIDASWGMVANRVSDKVSQVMREEIKLIWREYGSVVTRVGL